MGINTSLFTNIEELKNFILWSKEQGLKKIQIGDVAVEVSEVYYASKIVDRQELPTHNPSSKRFIDDESAQENDDELLFWSSGN